MTGKNTICLWYEAMLSTLQIFMPKLFPTAVEAIHRAPSDYPDGK